MEEYRQILQRKSASSSTASAMSSSSSYPPIETVSARVERRRRAHDDQQASSGHEDRRPSPIQPSVMWPQYLVTLACTMGSFVMGTTIGWTGPALPMLKDPGSGLGLTPTQENWAGSLMPAGALVGGVLGGFLVGRFGRRSIMVWNSVLCTGAFLVLVLADNAAMIFAGRLTSGLATGVTSVVAPTYISECVSAHARGFLGSIFQLMVTLGVLYVAAIGALQSWRWLSVACIAACLVWGVLLLAIPESPSLLLQHKKYDEARESLQFLRGHPYIETELQDIQESIEAAAARSGSAGGAAARLAQPHNIKPLLISLMLMLGQQLSGCNAIIFYSVKLFKDSGSSLNPFVASIVVTGVQVVATALASAFMDKLGRRILLAISSFLMAVSTFALGTFFWIQVHSPESAKSIGFLPMASLCLFIFSFSVGFGPIPWLIMSEVFGPDVKGLATSLSGGFNWSLAFVVTMFYGPVKDAVGAAATFWIFATITSGVFVACVAVVPETKGKTLEQIQQYFRSSSSPRRRHEDREPIVAIDDDGIEDIH